MSNAFIYDREDFDEWDDNEYILYRNVQVNGRMWNLASKVRNFYSDVNYYLISVDSSETTQDDDFLPVCWLNYELGDDMSNTELLYAGNGNFYRIDHKTNLSDYKTMIHGKDFALDKAELFANEIVNNPEGEISRLCTVGVDVNVLRSLPDSAKKAMAEDIKKHIGLAIYQECEEVANNFDGSDLT